jgi:hypothetical protein
MITLEKALLTKFVGARVIDIQRTDKLDKLQFAIPAAKGETVVEAWVGSRVTFSAIVDGQTVRLAPKHGVRYENLEQWIRDTVRKGD